MIYFQILFPIIVMFISVLLAYRRWGFDVRNIVITLLISAVVSGAASALSLRYTVISNPGYEAQISAKLPKIGNSSSSEPNNYGKRDSGGKWNEEFWMSFQKDK